MLLIKKITILLSSVLLTTAASAQLFSDDFDALNVGDYIGPSATEWTTWSGTEGGAEDAQANDTQSNSGANSIYFLGQAGGGPQDVILDFGQVYSDGVFTFESDFYVEAGKTGYFNFQANSMPGTTWAINCNMSNGTLTIEDDVTGSLAVGFYTEQTWFTLRIEANLSTGRWYSWIDGACVGVWNNGVNTLASLDLFPLETSEFYVDNVSFDHSAYTVSPLNASVAGFNMGGNISGLNVLPKVTIVNTGTTVITDFDVTVEYNGTPYIENIAGVNLLGGQSMEVAFTSPILLITGSNNASASVSNVNGGNDDDLSDDEACAVIDPIVPAPGKIVVGEEGTGTWCGWCPRGTVFMDRYEVEYGQYWAGIAVHNADPMAVAEYDTPFSAMIDSYPNALVDRGIEVDPSLISTDFFTRLAITPGALMTNGATWDETTRELIVSVTAKFTAPGSNFYKMLCVLTEDGITGTSFGYGQINYYSGGVNGAMGGYELLGDPVPAAQMVYDHVARAISPSFDGENTCFPVSIAAGDSVTNQYLFTLPATWDENNMHIIGILVSPNGRFDNAAKSSMTEAVNNGLIEGCNLSTGEIVISSDDTFIVYPNPATTITTIEINLNNDSKVGLRLLDISGKEISSVDYGILSSSSNVMLNTSRLQSGVYLIELTVDGERMTKRLIIE